MPRGNWDKLPQDRIGLIVALFLAALATIVILEMAWLQQRELYDEASRNAAHYARNAENDIAVKCVGPAAERSENCSREIMDAARQEQRDEYDLYSQRAMALWTAVMGGMAVFGVTLSAVGVYLIWGTFAETRRAADEARRSSDAFIANERGWLVLRLFGGRDKNSPDIYTLSFHVGVVGKAPIDLKSLHYKKLSSAAFPRDDNWSLVKPRNASVSPSAPGERGLGVVLGYSIDIPAEPCFVGGWIGYRTQFPGEYKYHFLREVFEMTNDKGVSVLSVREVDRDGWPENT